MKNKRFARLVIGFLFVFCFAFVPLKFNDSFFQYAEAKFPVSDDNKWLDYDNYTVINEDVIWSGNVVYDDIMKPVVIVDGATVTIEKGTHVSLLVLQVFYGRIVAEGTAEDPIIFTKATPNYWAYPDIDQDYDLACGSDSRGIVSFDDWSFAEGNDQSVFSHVKFENMGSYDYWNEEICSGGSAMFKNIKNSIFPKAYAQTEPRLARSNPALEMLNGKLRIEDSAFLNNSYADIVVNNTPSENGPNSFLEVVNSNFEGNKQNVALDSWIVRYDENANEYIHNKNIVSLENNWYGSPDGPRQSPDFSIGGEMIKGDYTLLGYSKERFEYSTCTDCASNVLFLPGIEASRLYDDVESTCPYDEKSKMRAWEPNCSDDVSRLYMNSDGESVREGIHVKEGDVLDNTPIGSGIYGSFIEKMNELKSSDDINDWKPIAYDWRMPLDDIVEDNSLVDKLRDLADRSKSKKVTIVAHSNGGLLAKELMLELGSEETKKLIDKVIFVAVPQVGTPDALAAMLHGYKQSIFPVLSAQTARGLAVNMSSAYNLLPSDAYFSTIHDPVITFDEDMDESDDWRDRYDDEIKSKDALDDFLLDNFRRVLASGSEMNIPALLNGYLLDNARGQQEALNYWTIPDGVRVIQVAGWGVDKTVKSIDYEIDTDDYTDAGIHYTDVDLLEPEMDSTIDGDGTVITPSALWMSGAEKYWVNMKVYNRNNPFETAFGLLGIDHKNILEIPQLNEFIKDSIIGSTKPLSEYVYLSTEVPPSSDKKRLQYTLHSPLTLDLYDEQKRHTGINEDGYVEEEIPGTYYSEIGDVKYIFSDEDFTGQIKMKGYDEGKFTFSVKEYEGDEKKGKITFKDMPVTSQTKVFFNIQNDLESAGNLEIDKDGDGDIDYSLEPKIGEAVTLDTTPPITQVTIEGTSGENGWYTSDVSLTLTAKDEEDGSGIEKTEYSTDNGNTWVAYTNPITFSQEGIIQIRYRSTDKQGNTEETKTTTIKIDKTAPEAKISFAKESKKLEITGMDNLSQKVSMVTEEKIIKNQERGHYGWNFWSWNWFSSNENKKIIETSTLIDNAGHQTRVVLEKKKNKNGFIDASIQSVSYDGQKNDLSKNNLQYKWALNWWKNKYLFFVSSLKTSSAILESHYLPKLDQTWIMEWPKDLPDDEKDEIDRRPVRKKMPGMIIPGIITEKGKLQIIY